MKILKENNSKKSLEVKVTQVYQALTENDDGDIHLIDFLRKDYPSGIREYIFQEVDISGKNPENSQGIYHFFSCYNNETARKTFEKYLPKKVLEAEFGVKSKKLKK